MTGFIQKLVFVLGALLVISSGEAHSQQPNSWNLGLGVGPNITQLDAVRDDLQSSVGAALWASREWGARNRLDISFDYFDFKNSGANYPSLNLGYGLRFLTDSKLKPFVLLGGGVGMANRFPRAVDTDQTAPHLFARAGIKELFGKDAWSVGLIYDFLYVKLDGRAVESVQLGLPMLTFSYRFDDESKTSTSVTSAAHTPPLPLVDSDGDGVYDNKDECPNTPTGKRVNSIGCQIKEKVTKRLNVEFDNNKFVVKENFFGVIDEFAKFLADNPDLSVTIEGHTDSVGSRESNMKLSVNRAQAVRDAISQRSSVGADRLKFKGYGPDRPVASNKDAEGRQNNRRVVAVITTEKLASP